MSWLFVIRASLHASKYDSQLSNTQIEYMYGKVTVFDFVLSFCSGSPWLSLSVFRDMNIRLTQASAVENVFRIAAFLLALTKTLKSLRSVL